MLEVTLAGEDHGDAVLVACLDGILVTDRSAGLDDGGDACLCSCFYAVIEGEEGIRSHNRACCLVACVIDCKLEGCDAVGLTGADTCGCIVLGEHDAVRLGVLDHLHGEAHVFHFLIGGSAVGDNLHIGIIEHLHVELLNEQTACNLLHVEHIASVGHSDVGEAKEAEVLLLGEDLEGICVKVGGDDDLKEDLCHFSRSLGIYLLIGGNNTAEEVGS